MSDIVIVKVKDGINIRADMMGYWRKEIIKQKETGVIVLPWFLTAITVKEDVEIQVDKETTMTCLGCIYRDLAAVSYPCLSCKRISECQSEDCYKDEEE